MRKVVISSVCFPEIPLFHILNARITFGNIFAMDKPVTGVQSGSSGKPCCVVDPAVFNEPQDYSVIGKLESFSFCYFVMCVEKKLVFKEHSQQEFISC